MIVLKKSITFPAAATQTYTITVPGAQGGGHAYLRVLNKAASTGNISAATVVTKPNKSKLRTIASFLTADFAATLSGDLLDSGVKDMPLLPGEEGEVYRGHFPAGEQVVISLTSTDVVQAEFELRIF